MKNEAPKPGRRVRGSRTGRPVMAALDLLGRRGTLRILWVLRDGVALTFRDLAAAAALAPATLNTRLSELRDAQLLAADDGYHLTPLGDELVAALTPLWSWSNVWSQRLSAPARKTRAPARRRTGSA